MSLVPTITDRAYSFLTEMYNSPVPHASFCQADMLKDDPVTYATYVESNAAWDELLNLGLAINVREQDMYRWLDKVEIETGRAFRVFQLTAEGRQLADPKNNAWKN